MPGRGAALENLGDDHASAAAWARVREAAWRPPGFHAIRSGPVPYAATYYSAELSGRWLLSRQQPTLDAPDL
jgi:hypothetical protein